MGRTRNGSTLAVTPARPGDYVPALQFLVSVFQGPSSAEFRATIDDPAHEPHDRLLIKDGHDVFGHALVTHRMVRLGQSLISAAGLHGLAVSTNLRRRGLGTLLLRRAERHMVEEGHVLGLLSTEIPEFFRRFGWVPCGRRNRLRANVCSILSALAAKGLYPKVRKPLDIRPLRRMEIPAVAAIYRKAVADDYGPLERSEAYWQWLVNRAGYDDFLVAIERPRARRAPRAEPRLVGYTVLRQDRIAELFTAPDHPRAGLQLLIRACGDALERGVESLQIDLAPKDPLIRVLRTAGACAPSKESRSEEVLMAKVLRPEKMLHRMGAELLRRAATADLPLPLELGLCVDSRKYLLAVGHGSAAAENGRSRRPRCLNVATGSLGRSYLRLPSTQLTNLLLGQIDWGAPGGVEPSTRLAEQAAHALFPQRAFWRPLFDDLPAGAEPGFTR